ncbi:hypothetical protein [Cyanobium sp. LEGE 06113]|uniref:hypothetical protein n=1 Tax=Cyanobium sp. LEGE 06113 TaxID=1297573 RepID=UPI00187FE079|nr:hypothetical protein [Cyanobium sp. LEGE 06113]MBE9153910.1 hypothetical protein [Cyanobium sp. LEGE 06113]
MGQITDSLRATLRELAQSDARLYRGLQEELGDTPQATSPPAPVLEGDAPASREELAGLSIAALWTLCKARGIKGLCKGPVEKQVDALLSHPAGPSLRSALPVKAAKGGRASGKLAASVRSSGKASSKASSKASGPELQQLEQCLDRLEQLVALIAQQVGVSYEAIERLLPSAPHPSEVAGRSNQLQRSIFAIREWRIAVSDVGPLPLQPSARPASTGSGGAAAPDP